MFESRTQSTRLVARQVSELILARGQRWQLVTRQDFLAGIVVDVVLAGSMAHLPLRDPETGRWVTLDAAPVLGRPVSATAIGQSMLLPATTTRRRAIELVAAGLLTRAPGGFRIAVEVVAGDAFVQMCADNTAHLARTIGSLAAAGYAPAERARAADIVDLPTKLVDRLVIEFGLRMLETMTQMYGDTADATLSSAIVSANIRHITADPALARRYAGEGSIPPDSERRPVTLRALARIVGMPFETVRRRVAALVVLGKAEQRDNGVVIPTRVLADVRHAENNGRITTHFEHMLNRLVLAAEQS